MPEMIAAKKKEDLFQYLPANMARGVVNLAEKHGYKVGESDTPAVIKGKYDIIGDTKFKKITKEGYVEVPKKEQKKFIEEVHARLGLDANPKSDNPTRLLIRLPEKAAEKESMASAVTPKPKKEVKGEAEAEASIPSSAVAQNVDSIGRLETELSQKSTEKKALEELKDIGNAAFKSENWDEADRCYTAIWKHLGDKKRSIYESALLATAGDRINQINKIKTEKSFES